MLIRFEKYQGTGNDFIIIDNRNGSFRHDTNSVKQFCDRKFGIGADGLMLLENMDGFDFKMVYFNADGNESSMCGNGGRCLSAFAFSKKVFEEKCSFMAIDGEHEAIVSTTNNEQVYWVSLKMKDVNNVTIQNDHLEIDTGSPHYLKFVPNVNSIDVAQEGRAIRNSELFYEEGINVNFLNMENNILSVRTYERGVEDETLSCGTGVTASALAASVKGLLNDNVCKLQTHGGNLQVKFERTGETTFENIWLEGDATFVFSGEIEL